MIRSHIRQTKLRKLGLTDGAGEQAFVLFTSQDPLPSYAQWEATLSDTQWPNPDVTGNWTYESGDLAALAFHGDSGSIRTTRGEVRTTKTTTLFKELCDRLRANKTTDVRGVIFEVQPMVSRQTH